MEQDTSSQQESPKTPWTSFAERAKKFFSPKQKSATGESSKSPNLSETHRSPTASARAKEYEVANPNLDFAEERILILDDGYHYLHDYDDPAIANYNANSPQSEATRDFLAHREKNKQEEKTRHRHQQKVLETLITGNINSLTSEPSPRSPQDYLAPLHQFANGYYSSNPKDCPFPDEPSFDSSAESSLLRKIISPLDQNPTATWNRITSDQDQFKLRLLARLTRNPSNPRENFNPTPSQEDLLAFYSNHPTPIEAEPVFHEALEFIQDQDRSLGRTPNPSESNFADNAVKELESYQSLLHDLYGKRQEYHDAITELRLNIIGNSGADPAKIHRQCENLAISFATPNR